ncbi:unnamed protein product [Moneuplotes crassus]|uniref:Uncharacterized protein n=1 Tax=Euplotes crassus TaxID=5936 RepID=A0AAD1Y0N4_EUPCR|nr:unnamed protein product [Moneuplotes crassus]
MNAKDKEQKICTEFLKTLRGLTHEKARCRAQVDFIANLQEDLQIVSSKLPKFSELEEDYIEYKEQANQKINILKEDAEKTKNELEIKNAQFIKTERELTEFKKLYIATKAQLERGDCKNSQFIASEISQNNDYIKEAIEGFEFLKKAIKDLQNKTEENDRLLSRELEQQESSSEIQDFLKETDNWVNNCDKNEDNQLGNPLLKRFLIKGGDIDLIPCQDSCYLAPTDIEQIISKQKEIQTLLSKNQGEISKLKQENSNLQAKIASLANIDQSDLEEIADAMADDKLEEIKQQFITEKEKIMIDFQERVKKILQLEMEIDVHQEQNSKLEGIIQSCSSDPAKAIQRYEKDLDFLNLKYQQVTGELEATKVEVKVSNKQIEALTKTLETARSELKKNLEETRNLRRIAQKLRNAIESDPMTSIKLSFGGTCAGGIKKVVKKVKNSNNLP